MVEEFRSAREARDDARDPEEREPSETADDDLEVAQAAHRDERCAVGLIAEKKRRPSILRRREIIREGDDRFGALKEDEEDERCIRRKKIAWPKRRGEVARFARGLVLSRRLGWMRSLCSRILFASAFF